MATFVLIAGAWHGAWCFERVAPLLQVHGHRVITPDLPGMGADRTHLSQVSFDGWSKFVAKLAASQSEPVILMGHSRGGMIISQAAEYAPHAIAKLVYVTAALPRDGQTMLEAAFGSNIGAKNEEPIALTADGLGELPPIERAKSVFYNLTEPALVARAISLLTAEPITSRTVRAALSPDRFDQVPRIYIECLRDKALPIEAQRRMQFASPCEVTLAIDCDHSPFYSAPQELADRLDSVA